jgi:uncharacterized RDD family membrane protein YckC
MLAFATGSIKLDGVLEEQAWARFLARCVDQLIVGLGLLSLTYGISLPVVQLEPSWDLRLDWLHNGWLGYVTLIGAGVIYDVALLAGFGSTPGKWLLGLTVTAADGARASVPALVKRSAILLSAGLALRVPVLGLLAQVGAGLRLVSKGATLWDSAARLEVQHRPVGFERWALALAALAALAYVCLASALPEIAV